MLFKIEAYRYLEGFARCGHDLTGHLRAEGGRRRHRAVGRQWGEHLRNFRRPAEPKDRNRWFRGRLRDLAGSIYPGHLRAEEG